MSNTDPLSFAPDALVRGGPRIATDGVSKNSISTTQAADHIAGPSWNDQYGQPLTITYAYRATGVVPADTGAANFSPFTAAQMVAGDRAFLAWSDVASIHFQRVDDGNGYSNNATILLGDYNTLLYSGFTYLPETGPAARAPDNVDGDVWIDYLRGYNAFPTLDNQGAEILIHEIGHSIGLNHPGAYNRSDALAPTYDASAEYYEDTTQYTVMSYFAPEQTGANLDGRFSAIPLLDDITAIQRIYGANMTAFTGDTVYGFNSNSGREWFSLSAGANAPIFAVWDAGGHDRFDFSGFGQAQLIDLRAGDFSDIGGLHGNVAIAFGVTIEDAIGGSGSDMIIGNAVANVLNGGAGQDTMSGEAGDDAVHGGSGNDQLDGGSGSDTLDGGDGDDRLLGSPGIGPAGSALESDYYMGGAGADTVTGGPGNDHIYGNALTTVAGATDGADSLSGGDGNDYVQGNAGADRIDGGAGNDRVYGGADADTIDGGAGNDYLQGNKGADSLSGGDGNDTIRGGADNDTLTGGAGLDQMSGDAGNDRFVFAGSDAGFATDGGTAFATDHIADFGNGADLIQLPFHVAAVLDSAAASAAAAFANASALLAGTASDVVAVAVGSDTILFYHGTGGAGAPDAAITLDGVNAATITTASFV
ncbi:MAG TPA: M10 family metallopeptidase C-terminal domain-containing protein [Sphingomonas sp.]|uniref:M10 family metallopeptidase C-terminal domain-containing protein n=1 Tax=Sphingomonas sp. TaxID=28214 RepID=UPI002B74F005|nr:M10 family metallopeptidase C-terminal domain-containing protein [Sphingomonas sp.]HMI18619.1 M10 family metallopeptidase C-terminal domain-containing protein [Sphingomonas sp.]